MDEKAKQRAGQHIEEMGRLRAEMLDARKAAQAALEAVIVAQEAAKAAQESRRQKVGRVARIHCASINRVRCYACT